MSPAQWFKNTRISVKMVVAPAVVVALMVVMGFVASHTIWRQGRVLSQFGQVLLPRNSDIDLALQLATDAHVDLFRAVTWVANSDDASKLAEAASNASGNLDRLDRFLGNILKRWAVDGIDRKPLDAALSEARAYQAISAAVLKMAAVDPPTSFIMMLQAEKRFGLLRTHLTALREAEASRSRGAIEAALLSDHQAQIGFVGLLAGAVASGAVVSVLIARMISRPLSRMTHAMTALAAGNDTQDRLPVERRDEVGRMAAAVLVFRETLVVSKQLAAERDAIDRKETKRVAKFGMLSAGFSGTMGDLVGSLSRAARDMTETAQSMDVVAGVTNERSTSAAMAVCATERNVTAIAAATAQLSQSITEIGRQVSESVAMTGDAVTEARHTDSVTRSFSDGVRSIDKAVRLIRAIAAKINLLALNATIEAARAGEAGRGFAVVAGEVKALAVQTGKATDEIDRHVQAIQSSSAEAVEAVARINARILSVENSASAVTKAVGEQERATSEIAAALSHLVQGNSDITENSIGIREVAGQTSAAAQSVLGAAKELHDRAGQITLHLDDYLTQLKAA